MVTINRLLFGIFLVAAVNSKVQMYAWPFVDHCTQEGYVQTTIIGFLWKKLKQTQIIFHFLPLQLDSRKAENFDMMFTSKDVKMTPTDNLIIMNIDDSAFRNFSFVNPFFSPNQSESWTVVCIPFPFYFIFSFLPSFLPSYGMLQQTNWVHIW